MIYIILLTHKLYNCTYIYLYYSEAELLNISIYGKTIVLSLSVINTLTVEGIVIVNTSNTNIFQFMLIQSITAVTLFSSVLSGNGGVWHF